MFSMFNAKVMVIQFGRQSHIIFPSLPEEGREEFHSTIEAHFLRILLFMLQWQIYMFVYDIHVYICMNEFVAPSRYRGLSPSESSSWNYRTTVGNTPNSRYANNTQSCFLTC